MSDRSERLVTRLPEFEIVLMVVSDLVNVRYLTGYTGSNGLALVGPTERVFFTDGRYTEQAAAQVDSSYKRHTVSLDLLEAVAGALRDRDGAAVPRLGFENEHSTIKQHDRLAENVGEHAQVVGVPVVVG